MVYSAPKWFLALRRAGLAIVGVCPSVDQIILRVYFLLKLPLMSTTESVTLNIQLSLGIKSRDVFVNMGPVGIW